MHERLQLPRAPLLKAEHNVEEKQHAHLLDQARLLHNVQQALEGNELVDERMLLLLQRNVIGLLAQLRLSVPQRSHQDAQLFPRAVPEEPRHEHGHCLPLGLDWLLLLLLLLLSRLAKSPEQLLHVCCAASAAGHNCGRETRAARASVAWVCRCCDSRG